MMTFDTAVRLPPGGNQAKVEVRQLIAGLRDASRAGARTVQRSVELFEKVVEEYCVKFEQQTTPALTRFVAR